MSESRPPRHEGFGLRSLSRLIPQRYREDVIGDLLEERAQVARRWGRVAAGGWLTVRIVCAALAVRRARVHNSFDRRRSGNGRRRGDAGAERAVGRILDPVLQDVRFALRTWRRAPLFTAAVLVTLGGGLGLTLAAFAVLSGVLVRPLDYPEPERLLHVQGPRAARFGVSMPVHLAIAEDSSLVESASAWQGWPALTHDAEGHPTRRFGASVSAAFFEMLGTQPAAGRLFGAEDAAAGHTPVVVFGHALWQGEYGGRRDVIGRTLRLDDTFYRVVGIAPPDFVDPVTLYLGWSTPELWRAQPPVFEEARHDPGWVGFWSLVRLRPGASPHAFGDELRTLLDGHFGRPEEPWEVRAVTFKEAVVEDVRPTLIVLFAAVVGVLLIACANVANLLLGRATVRAREITVRSSLGAARGRIVRQLFTESVLLSLASVVLGLALSLVATRAVLRLAASEIPRTEAIGLDWRVLAFGALAALVTAVLFGLVPALRLSGMDAAAELRQGGRVGAGGRRAHTLRASLLVVETALATVLLVSAGLLLVTVARLQAVDPGFDPEGALAVPVGLWPEHYPQPALQNLAVTRITAAATSVEGVRAAGIITDLPLSGAVNSTRVLKSGEVPETAPRRPHVLVRAIDSGYLGVMGIGLKAGRALSSADVTGAQEVAVVNESFARAFFPDGSVLDAAVLVRGVERRIVGVAGDVKEFTLDAAGDPVLYTPYAQEREAWMRGGFDLVVRTAGEPAELARVLRRRLLESEPVASIGDARTLRSLVERHVAAPRFRAILVLLVAAVAIFLTAVGLGGVTAYTVSRRVPEIGLRLALGARSWQVQAVVLERSALLCGAGLVVGIFAALVAGRFLEGFLFGVDAREPAVFVGVALLLGGIALAASWVPARRAARIDPATTLRQD